MINSNEQEDRKAARKKQEERARAVSAGSMTGKRNSESYICSQPR
jgi:hypothetical protein